MQAELESKKHDKEAEKTKLEKNLQDVPPQRCDGNICKKLKDAFFVQLLP